MMAGMDHHPLAPQPLAGIHVSRQVTIDAVTHMRRVFGDVDCRHGVNADPDIVRLADRTNGADALAGKALDRVRHASVSIFRSRMRTPCRRDMAALMPSSILFFCPKSMPIRSRRVIAPCPFPEHFPLAASCRPFCCSAESAAGAAST